MILIAYTLRYRIIELCLNVVLLCVMDTTDHGRNSHEEKSLYLAHTRTIRKVLRQRSWWLKVEAEAIFHVRINRIKWIPLRVVCAATHNTQAHPHAIGSTRSVQSLAPRSSQYIDADENTNFECKNKGRRQTCPTCTTCKQPSSLL
eukprot:COSAG05_NODE_10319_length_571_cov_22.919492_2_plen_146_part_00